MMVCFALGGVVGTVLPLLAPKLPTEIKLFSLLYGVASSCAFTFAVYTRNRKEKIYKSLDDAQSASLADQMKHTISLDSAVQRIESQRRLAGYISQLPQHEQPRWVQMFGLGGIIPPPTIDAVVEETKIIAIAPPKQSSFEEISEDLAPKIDYSWLDEKFVSASKVVFGPKGSGKSVYLAYEAVAFLQLNPDGELRIGDRHFSEESQWLPGIPADVLEKQFVATKSEQILAMFRRAGLLLRHRVNNGIRLSHPDCKRFKLICDEFESFVLHLSDDEKNEVMSILAQSQDEGRKYGVDITLGVHSLKKERIGVDSSVLFQMDVLCLGQALADPNTKFPADFNTKKLLEAQHLLNSSLRQGDGFACVVRKLGEMPQVAVIPFIDLSQVQVQLTNEQPSPQSQTQRDWLEEMNQWILSLGRTPAAAEVKAKWESLTGHTLNTNGLNLLMEHLGLTGRPDMET